MPEVMRGPSLLQDLGALAGLYRNVFWMMGHKERWPRWSEEWPSDASRLSESEPKKERSGATVGTK